MELHICRRGKCCLGPVNPSTETDDGIKCFSDKDTYRYLGVKQLFTANDKNVKDSVIA